MTSREGLGQPAGAGAFRGRKSLYRNNAVQIFLRTDNKNLEVLVV